ncbi:MAG: hypothetical protein R3194_10735 [Limnobacter sp.]|nr:hypothetical protein [Limnobacter sp.]
MQAKLIQVLIRQKPIGYLGFESGIYRFHYLQEIDGHAISPLMPASRMFYESKTLFPVFAQLIDKQLEGLDALSALEKQGHMGLGTLSFVDASRPRLLPRLTLPRETLRGFSSWNAIEEALSSKATVQTVLSNAGFECLMVHTTPSARYPDCMVHPNSRSSANPRELTSLQGVLEKAKASNLNVPEYEVLEQSDTALITRPDIDSLGYRLPAHSLASLAGLTPAQAATIYEQHPRKACLQIAVRAARFYGASEPVVESIQNADALFAHLNPLNHLWKVGGQWVFLP